MGRVVVNVSRNHIARYDSPCLPVLYHKVHHLLPAMYRNGSCRHLSAECSVCSDQKLLAGLAPGIKSPADEGTPERTVVKISAVIPGKGNAQRNTMVNNAVAYLGQPVHIGFPGTVIAPFEGIEEKAVYRIVVVPVILGCIDSSLGRDGMCPPGRIAHAKHIHAIPLFSECRRCRSPGQSRSHHNNVHPGPVGRRDRSESILVPLPF